MAIDINMCVRWIVDLFHIFCISKYIRTQKTTPGIASVCATAIHIYVSKEKERTKETNMAMIAWRLGHVRVRPGLRFQTYPARSGRRRILVNPRAFFYPAHAIPLTWVLTARRGDDQLDARSGRDKGGRRITGAIDNASWITHAAWLVAKRRPSCEMRSRKSARVIARRPPRISTAPDTVDIIAKCLQIRYD